MFSKSVIKEKPIINTTLAAIIGAAALCLTAEDARSEPTVWVEKRLVRRAKSDDFAEFGRRLSIDGDLALIGAAGEVYVYSRSKGGWYFEDRLQSSGPGGFGSDISLDDEVAVVGAYGNPGSAHIFTRTPTGWIEETLPINSAGYEGGFGNSVAVDGDTAVIGAYLDDDRGENAGAIYIYTREASGIWNEQKLLAGDLSDGDEFGYAVALSGNTLAVSARGQEVDGTIEAGAVYIFVRMGDSWVAQAKLTADDPDSSQWFGDKLDIDMDTVVVGESQHDELGTQSGAAYVFSRSGSEWSFQGKLLAGDGKAYEYFGRTVAVYGETVVVGAYNSAQENAPGSAYVFERDGNEWTQAHKIISDDSANGDNFGLCVDIDDYTIVVHQLLDSEPLYGRGSVSLFEHHGSSWVQRQKIFSSDENGGDNFGNSVALHGETAVVGAKTTDDQADGAGSAFVFVRDGDSWVQADKLLPTSALANDFFGTSVAVHENTVLVGAPGESNSTTTPGYAYAFVRDGGSWSLQQKLERAAGGVNGDRFGYAVALFGDVAIIGAPNDSYGEFYSGSVFGFYRSGDSWSQYDRLEPDASSIEGYFGTYLAMSADTLVTSSNTQSDYSPGVVNVFDVVVDTGVTFERKDVFQQGDNNDNFSKSLDLSGDYLIAGAPGSEINADDDLPYAQVWVRGGDETWSLEQTLTGSDPITPISRFGKAVAIETNMAAVGHPGYSVNGYDSGAVHLFVRNAGTWTETEVILPSDGRPLAEFGSSIALDQNYLLIGAPMPPPSIEETVGPGAAYLFERIETLSGGATCTADEQCTSGFCTEGVCCDQRCEDPCKSCAQYRKEDSSADGVCGQVTPGLTCGTGGGCASSSEYNLSPKCDDSGACQTNHVDCQGDFACVNSVCATTCRVEGKDQHVYCIDSHYCSAGNCIPKKGVGSLCQEDAECQSGACVNSVCRGSLGEACDEVPCAYDFCQDGFCCNSICTGQCEACDVAGEEGSCVPVTGEPHGSRTPCFEDPDYPECAGDIGCDGVITDQCYYPTGISCGDSQCVNGTAFGAVCSGDGHCVQESTGMSCYPYSVCADEISCLTECTNDTQCVTTHYCDLSGETGACVPLLDDGTVCQSASECASGFCADGYCCNTACTGQCEACGEEGDQGKCVPVTGQPVAPRLACDLGEDTSCHGECNGAFTGSCVFPGFETLCGNSSCVGNSLVTERCDGAGTCKPSPTQDCGAYACDDDAVDCKSSCTTNQDCASGAVCELATGECAFESVYCEGPYTLVEADGTKTSCEPYLCVGGACQQQCSDNLDCVGGTVCVGSSCVDPYSVGDAGDLDVNSDSGCNCSAVGDTSEGWSLGSLLYVVMALFIG